MYNFDGEYRRTKAQNLSGASKLSSGKDELITRAHKERMKRQAERHKEISAIRIQKVIRGFLCRSKIKRKFYSEFNQCMGVCNQRQTLVSDVQYMISRFYFISRRSISHKVLIEVTKKALLVSNEIINLACRNHSWLWRVKVLLKLLLDILELTPIEMPIDPSLIIVCDALDTFTALNSKTNVLTIKKIFTFLINHNYLMSMRDFVVAIYANRMNIDACRTMSCISQFNIEFSIKMFTRPITLLDRTYEPAYRNKVLHYLCKAIATGSGMSGPFKQWIVPVLKSMHDFPLQHTMNLFRTYNSDMNDPFILYYFLVLDQDQKAISIEAQPEYFKLLTVLTRNLVELASLNLGSENDPEISYSSRHYERRQILADCLQLLNTPARSQVWMDVLQNALIQRDDETIINHAICVHNILLCDVNASFKFRIIKDLGSARDWIRGLWVVLESQMRAQRQVSEESTSLLAVLKRGSLLTRDEVVIILPLLIVFCTYLNYSLSFLTDEDLLKEELILEHAVKPFNASELIYIGTALKDVAVGLISLAYPDVNSTPLDYVHLCTPTDNIKYNSHIWLKTLVDTVKVAREIYFRCERCEIIEEEDFYSVLIPIPDVGVQCISGFRNYERKYPPFRNYTLPPLSIESPQSVGCWHDRAYSLLTQLPFTVAFSKRYKGMTNFFVNCFYLHQNPDQHFLQNAHISVIIRRDYIYEDSFEKFSIDNAPELKIAIRVHFLNRLNIAEPGIDGGGIFKEFISDLLRTAFDPNRGFFILTKDNKLYPNPNVALVYPNFTTHYFFIGRMLGKAIYENVLIDLPLADFFLARVIESSTLYPSMLQTLDTDLFKNISYLRTFNGDYSTLGLDFTTTTNSLGLSNTVELLSNGADIQVNEENVMEYMQLITKQKLQLDISKQTRAFTKGLGNIIPLHFIRMFTPLELQEIVSGECESIDVDDMEKSAVYTGGYTPAHPNVQMFWRIVKTFGDRERSLLLKFVTSCVRPPLSGFKALRPPFCVQFAEGGDSRLPTSSTCMHILKLPMYSRENTMKEKLIYAISSGSGFELS